jgi:hypothetical protein
MLNLMLSPDVEHNADCCLLLFLSLSNAGPDFECVAKTDFEPDVEPEDEPVAKTDFEPDFEPEDESDAEPGVISNAESDVRLNLVLNLITEPVN